jgi:predicted ATPase
MYLKAITFRTNEFPARDVYPFNIGVFQSTDRIELTSPVTILVGQNGSGKSALLDAIARKSGLLPWGGHKMHRSHGNPYESQLANYISLFFDPRHPYGFHFRAEAFFNFAASLDDIILDDPNRDRYFGGKSLNVLSHGESFLAFFKSYSFQLDGLYLIDEPEAALSPRNQLAFVRTVREALCTGGRQYLIATHSPIVMACPGACVLNFDGPRIERTGYRDSGHFQFYKDFLENPECFFGPCEPAENELKPGKTPA